MARKENIRDELIRAGIEELNLHSIVDFQCAGLQPNAAFLQLLLYKHFKNKQEFIAK